MQSCIRYGLLIADYDYAKMLVGNCYLLIPVLMRLIFRSFLVKDDTSLDLNSFRDEIQQAHK